MLSKPLINQYKYNKNLKGEIDMLVEGFLTDLTKVFMGAKQLKFSRRKKHPSFVDLFNSLILIMASLMNF